MPLSPRPVGPALRWAGATALALALIALLGAAVGAPRAADTLTRGPYLQRVSPTAAIVRWRTAGATATWLAWGGVPGDFSHVVTDFELRIEHRVALSGLAPDSVHYYAVGAPGKVLAGGDGDHFFRTAPDPTGPGRPFRVWVLGDSGTAGAGAAAVRDAYAAWSVGTPTDLWLLLGDNAYLSGTDAQYQAALFDMYPEFLRQVFLWPELGNHDAISSDSPTQSGPYFANFSLPRFGESGGLASGTEAYYSFDYGDAHFLALDTADTSLAPGSPMLGWLSTDLAATDRRWRIAFFHHPPYSKGSHDSDDPLESGGRMFQLRENVLPLLEAAGIDLVLAGHSHSYERSYLLDRHYGTSDTLEPWMLRDAGDGNPAGDGPYRKPPGSHGGAVFVVAGCAASIHPGPLGHPAMAVSLLELGSLVVDVAADAIEVRFLTDGAAVGDHFRLEKMEAIFADGFESGDLLAWSAANP